MNYTDPPYPGYPPQNYARPKKKKRAVVCFGRGVFDLEHLVEYPARVS